MNIHTLLPFGIRDDQDSVGADAILALTAGIHLDRRNARRIGWRGLHPYMSTGYAWTIRTAERQGVYGLAFLGEERDETCLRSLFSLFYFPDPEEAVLATYMGIARQAATAPGYFAGIRKFTCWEAGESFFIGSLHLNIRLDLKGLSFDMEALARQRIVAVDGLPEEGVEKNGWACNVPAFRLSLPFVRLLALSAASLLESSPRWAISHGLYPVTAFTADGSWGIMGEETLRGMNITAGFGESVPPYPNKPPVQQIRPLAGRAFMLKEQEVEDNLPVLHIVSGFLGSGKTTFLSEWLTWLHNHNRHTADLQNEFGEKNLDSFLLEHETISEVLDEGCVCCTLADNLRPAIRRLLDIFPTEQIILETTGVANPGAVADALDDLGDLVRPGLCISLVDMRDGDKLIACGPDGLSGLAGEQIRQAGVLICNKTDAISQEHLDKIIKVLKKMNPTAVIFSAAYGRIPFGELDRLTEFRSETDLKAATALRPRPQHITHLDEGYESLVLEVVRPVNLESLNALVRLARDRVPRIKGIIDSMDENRPMIVQYAAGVLMLETPLSPPDPARFLVLIGKGFDAVFVASLSGIPGLAVQKARPSPLVTLPLSN